MLVHLDSRLENCKKWTFQKGSCHHTKSMFQKELQKFQKNFPPQESSRSFIQPTNIHKIKQSRMCGKGVEKA